ncbi:hypothetical protein CONPUDRAFT_83405 [Coniophora puteana RWD-64-598 SS2]|uniref:Uncharacterized protein n=1 Tax=Coniophora puteana (strain RWD-64-598) TaxID=741705 RepID=A0A5M3MJT7_CONPW|nr:uncharacterized protein CONPUDRAFT_83405 [Coniophora puteana RWD-64-598 SS2]EIW79064.1 hypothetical protein CONPUDRAFT_83405 [Coniophora puteana RWD-64-598 SS2]
MFVKHIGDSAIHSKHYTNIASILVESCALFTITSVIFIGFYLAHNAVQFLMIAVLAQVQIIAPLLVMLRISKDVAWEADTATTVDHSESTRACSGAQGRHRMIAMTGIQFAKDDGGAECGTEGAKTIG